MNQQSIILCALLLFLATTPVLNGEELIPQLRHSCVVPDGLRKEIILQGKGTTPRHRDAHQIYQRHHLDGWNIYMRYYSITGITNGSSREDVIPAEYRIMTTARRVGKLEAQAAVMKAELIFGQEKIRATIKQYYLEISDKEILEAFRAARAESARLYRLSLEIIRKD